MLTVLKMDPRSCDWNQAGAGSAAPDERLRRSAGEECDLPVVQQPIAPRTPLPLIVSVICKARADVQTVPTNRREMKAAVHKIGLFAHHASPEANCCRFTAFRWQRTSIERVKMH
jgi:hypothetical protein